MKDLISLERLVKSGRRKQSSESSDSDKESVPVITRCTGNKEMSDSANSDDTGHKIIKKRKHHHHHHHKRKHKERDNERHAEMREDRLPDHRSSRHHHSSHRRHGEEHMRMKVEDGERCHHSSRHRQHRDESGDQIRHHRKRDAEGRHRRDYTSRIRRSSTENENREEANAHRDRRGDAGGGRKHTRNGDQSTFPLNRPIKQERVSEERDFQWGNPSASATAEGENAPPKDKEKPNFGLSGKLAEETNTFNGVVLKYSEPQEARKPKRRWRFYPFKGDQGLPTLYLHRQSCYLIGRDRKVADIPVDHPSCSKQHAALQYRLVPYTRDDGSTGRRVRPYIIDLESANGTYVNNNKIEGKKYIELLEKDVVKFGYSSREYVLLHEHSKDDTMDDDVAPNASP